MMVSKMQNHCSRKGFFAINVQAAVDKKKHVLFQSIMSRGAEQSIQKFGTIQMAVIKLESNVGKGIFFQRRLSILLNSFLLTPYDNAIHVLLKTITTFPFFVPLICGMCIW